jgi:hypothetical protein
MDVIHMFRQTHAPEKKFGHFDCEVQSEAAKTLSADGQEDTVRFADAAR